jgi:glyoxylate carboligase
MRNKTATRYFYITQLGFQEVRNTDYEGYLMIEKVNANKALGTKEFIVVEPRQQFAKFGQST